MDCETWRLVQQAEHSALWRWISLRARRACGPWIPFRPWYAGRPLGAGIPLLSRGSNVAFIPAVALDASEEICVGFQLLCHGCGLLIAGDHDKICEK